MQGNPKTHDDGDKNDDNEEKTVMIMLRETHQTHFLMYKQYSCLDTTNGRPTKPNTEKK